MDYIKRIYSKPASCNKRKVATTQTVVARPWKRAKKNVREAAVALMKRIENVATDATEDRVFDNRVQIIQKVRSYFVPLPACSKDEISDPNCCIFIATDP